VTEQRFTTEDKRQAIDRELRYRRHVYARRVANGQMTQQLADRQIAVMEAILADYQQAAQSERLV
jgi:hypothetical protein